MPELLYEQEGGKMEPSSKDSGGGPKIGTTTIDMKIQLVADASLPSYLIPTLTCGDTAINITGSKVSITLTGDSLRAETTPKDFKCEITSNFLTKDEKSAITIETYYVDSSLPLLVINKIYFDESLLSYYDNSKVLTKSDNPFLANATTPDSGVTYTFEFDFDDIINAIKKLPSYGQIQNMFTFVNNIPGTGVPKTTLINISDGGFLNLKFSGVPFSSTRTDTSTLTLNIATTNGPIPAGYDLTKLFGSDILKDNVHKVLELKDYKDFDFTKMAKAQVLQPVTPPVVDSAATELAKAETAHKEATAAAEVAATKAIEVKKTAKTEINTAVDGIKTKMGSISSDDNTKIPPAVKPFIDASDALATAKAGGDVNATAKAEAALKAASAAIGLKEAIDEGLATTSSLPPSVQAVLTEAKTIQDAHAKMDAADAEVVKTKAVVDATRAEADKAQAAYQAKAMLNTRTGTEAAAGSAINVVNTNNTQAASTTSKELENKLKESIAAQSKKLDDVIAQLEALQKSQTNTGSTSVAGFGNVIVRAPGDSDACGNGGISMESRDGSLIFKVPYDKIISEIAPNMRSAMAQRALAKKAAGPNAADTNAAILVSEDPNAAISVSVDPNAAKPVSAPAGAVVVVDQSTKDELQKAKTYLATAIQQFDAAKTKLALINPAPTPVIDAGAANTALAGANSAITAADSAMTAVTTPQTLATAKQKVTEATAAVLAVTTAVNDFSAKVDAAAQAKPAGAPGAGAAATLDAAETAALAKAKTDLTAQQLRLTDASITTSLAEITALDTAIQTAEAAVGAVDALASAADDAAKATALTNARDKIALLAGLVTAVTTAVNKAIVAKPAVSSDDTKIQALTKKLKDEATDVLAAAKGAYGAYGAYGAIVTKPNPPITFTTEDGLITTATAAIAKATNAADAAGKAAAIVTATTAVDAAIAAAKKADDAVKAAAGTPPATKVTGLSAAKQKEFDGAKASLKAEETKLNAAKGELDAIKPEPDNLSDLDNLHQTATEAIAPATKALDEVDALVIKINTLPDDAEKATAVTAAEVEVDKAVALVKTAVDAVKTAVDAINLAKPLTYQTYETAYTAYKAEKAKFESSKQSATALQAGGATPAEQITEAKETLKTDVQAIKTPANIDKLSQENFDKLNDDAKKEEAITAVKDATALYTKIIQDITDTMNTYNATKTSVIAAAKQKLDTLINHDAAIKGDIVAEKQKLEGSGDKPKGKALLEINKRIEAFELTTLNNKLEIDKAQQEYDEVKGSQGGGSKQSKSSSSKSKSSSPKSKSKNKTKKNHHSKSKSNKNKTPKIIMNE